MWTLAFWNCWCQLSCNLSDQLQHVISAVSSVATYQLSCTGSAQMKLVISTATCWLSCSLSAQLQLVNSAAKAQVKLLAWLSAQLHPVSSDVICHFSSSASSHHQSIISAAVYPLSYILSFLGSYLMCHISWNLSAGRTRQWCLKTYFGPSISTALRSAKDQSNHNWTRSWNITSVGNDDCWAF